ncbi:MAG: S8 family serine peptidase [Nanoarchaeota archaeon]
MLEIEGKTNRATGNVVKDYFGITGNAVASLEAQQKVLNEYERVFNGIALDISAEEAENIENIDGVKSVSLNYEVKALMMNSIPLVGADKVWQLDKDGNNCVTSGKECLTGKGIKIGIIDTGVDYTHGDLGGCFGNNCKVAGGYDFVNNDNEPMDDNGHGTHVAGTAAGSGDGGLKGMAPDAILYSYKVCNSNGVCWGKDIIAAIDRSVDLNNNKIPCETNDYLDVISLSLGGPGDPDDPMSTAIDNAAACTVAVIAAGNSGPNAKTIRSPGTARKAITVGATLKKDYTSGRYVGKKDTIASFSSRGPVIWSGSSITKPDIVAPGAIICSAEWGNAKYPNCEGLVDTTHGQISGTSMATPHVTGAVALFKQKHPDWKPEEIKAALKNTAKKLIDPKYDKNTQGSGRLDIKSAIVIEKKPIIFYIKIEGFEKVNIKGTIKGDELKKYELYYGKGEDPSEWIKITEGNNQVIDGILYQGFDSSILYEGINYLRLRVFDNSENEYEEEYIIYYYKPNPNLKQLTYNGFKQYDGAIYKNKVVWTGIDSQIYMYDLITEKTTRITKSPFKHYSHPDVYENKIIYLSGSNIYVYDLTTNEEIQITDSGFPNWPRIYENKIVYWDLRGMSDDMQIYMYDLETKEEKLLTTIPTRFYSWIHFYKNKFVATYGFRIQSFFLYDIENNEKTSLFTSPSGTHVTGDIYEDTIVFDAAINNQYDIVMYNIITEEIKILTRPNGQFWPNIYKNKLVWIDYDYSNSKQDLFMYDLITNEEMPIKLYGNEWIYDVYENNILFEYDKYGDRNLFLYTLSDDSPPICGNNKKEGIEQCDGSDDALCPGQCTAQCTCPAPKPQCGDGIDNDDDRLIDSLDKGCWTNVNDPASYNSADTDESDEILNSLQSKLANLADSVLTGQLQIKLQKKVSGNWQDVSTVVNQQVSIPANRLLKLDTGKDNLGNHIFLGFNIMKVKADSAGDYRVYARFEKDGKIVESNWDFKVG